MTVRPINPESAAVRVYNEKGMAVICVKRYPSMALTYHQLSQVQYLLGLDPHVIDVAAFLSRELGEEAELKVEEAAAKSGLELAIYDET